MVGRKTAVEVIVNVEENGHIQPVAFIWEGITFGICGIVKEHCYPTEKNMPSANRVFYCLTYLGPIHLYFLSGRWFVCREVR